MAVSPASASSERCQPTAGEQGAPTPLPPPRQARPPRPGGVHRPQPHLQAETPGSSPSECSPLASPDADGAWAKRRSAAPTSQPGMGYPRAQAPSASSGGPGTVATQGQGAAASAPAASSASASASVASSSASTRAPSPAALRPAAVAVMRQGNVLHACGQVDAPVRWRWRPQDEEHRLREQGLGAGHLRGRRANLAKIREIQGLG
mmetsp:Transcript_64531/g.183192  ORF Transcript_64531/g.183192 Transcript_64531/m.183192 type:complete len:206 (+) Transcript_64531:123-740(+)